MNQDPRTDFEQAVQGSSEVPGWVRKEVASVHGLESKVLEQSYLDFLDDEIIRESRGPDWTQVLKRWRTALQGFCGKCLVSGIIGQGNERIFLKIDPATRKVLYWEEWPLDDAGAVEDEQR